MYDVCNYTHINIVQNLMNIKSENNERCPQGKLEHV